MAQFHLPFPAPGARARLAVFHHAGGSSMSFGRLARFLSGPLEVLLAELPGRATRHAEAPGGSVKELAQDFARGLKGDPRPLTLYGHSLGGVLAFEVALALKGLVQNVVVSCVRAPNFTHGAPALQGTAPELWTEDLLLEAIHRYGPLPPALASPAAREYFLPLFRQDFALARSYLPASQKLDIPLLALAGREDSAVSPAEVEAWRDFTTGEFCFRLEAGGHFCVLDREELLPSLFGPGGTAAVLA